MVRQFVSHASTDYAAFIVTAVIVLVVTLIYLWVTDKKKSQLSFPGLASTDPVAGNFGDIKKAGSLHEFLVDLHKRFGPIASFWWGTELAVSLGSPEVWKDVLPLFDRPVNQFIMFRPLIGKYSIQYANQAEGRKRRQLLDKSYSHQAMDGYLEIFIKIGNEIVKKWKSMSPDEHIPLKQYMHAIALKSITRSSFGDYFDSDKKILEFGKYYDICWSEMESQLDGKLLESGSQRQKDFDGALKKLKETIAAVIKHRRSQTEKKHRLLLDVILEEDSHFTSEEMICDNSLTYIIGGFHTTGYLLTWAIYFLSKDPDIQNKIYKEYQDVVGDRELTLDDVSSLTYLRQVIDESLRTSVLAPWAARYSDYDIVVGGHTIPKRTPLILSLGRVLQNPEIWPEPERFDPSRFDLQKMKTHHPLTFSPFGFAGKRKCPGYRFSNLEAAVFLSMLVKQFKFNLVEGQNVEKEYGLVTTPKEEIWITVDEREPSSREEKA